MNRRKYGIAERQLLVFLAITALSSLIGGCKAVILPAQNSPAMTITLSVSPPIYTSTLTPIPTLTTLPTLSKDEAYDHLLTLLNDTTNCRLPCWLGITPGQSTLHDVLTLIKSLSSIDSKKDYVNPITGNETFADVKIPYPNDNAVIGIAPSYMMASNEDKVLVANFDTQADWYLDGKWAGAAFGNNIYNQLLRPYTLSKILSGYGQPTQIYILGVLRADNISFVSQTPDPMDRFFIHLLFPDRGILMIYEMPIEGRGNYYRICPSTAMITGEFTPSGNVEDFYNVLHQRGEDLWKLYPPDWVNFKTPEKAFGMAIEQFDQLFLSNSDSCLETPKSIWWPEDLWNNLNK